MDKIKILKLSKESLESSISGLSQLKPILQRNVIAVNGGNKKQGKEDSKELGGHFDTAINAMAIVLGLMEDINAEATNTEDSTENILREYAEDIYEEFQQVQRFEGKITLKDIADILHMNE